MTVFRVLAAYALVFGISPSVTSAQTLEGRIYVLHSRAMESCPALDWHIVPEANGALSGMIAWDNMRTMAQATGMLDRKNHTFSITATEVGGQARSVEIDRIIKQDGTLVANIRGPNVNCSAIAVPAFAISPVPK